MTPSSFREDLRRFDKELRLGWSGKDSRWEIWHKDNKGVDYLVLFTDMGTLGPKVIERLWTCTPMKQGGAEKVNAIMDAMDQKLKAEEARVAESELDALGSEAYDSVKTAVGEKVFMPGFTIRDSRRAVHA